MLDDWKSLNSQVDFSEKLDAYDVIRSTFPKRDPVISQVKKGFSCRDNNCKQRKPPKTEVSF